MEVPNVLIRKSVLEKWGYVQCRNGYWVNWNSMWLKKKSIFGNIWEYGDPNWHTIDEDHPFIKKGEVCYIDELDALQREKGMRGLEYKGDK